MVKEMFLEELFAKIGTDEVQREARLIWEKYLRLIMDEDKCKPGVVLHEVCRRLSETLGAAFIRGYPQQVREDILHAHMEMIKKEIDYEQ